MSESTMESNLENIKHVLETEIRPILNMDGGDVAFVDYTDGVLKVQLQGACHGCPGAQMTLKMGIERRLKEYFSELKEVQAV